MLVEVEAIDILNLTKNKGTSYPYSITIIVDRYTVPPNVGGRMMCKFTFILVVSAGRVNIRCLGCPRGSPS